MASVDIPHGQSVVKVSVIDTGARIKGPLSFFMEPSLLDSVSDHLSGPAFAFLVEHSTSGRRILFDLGIRKNYEEYPPVVREYHKAFQWETGPEVFELLKDGGLDLNTIEAIIWRYAMSSYILVRC